MSAKTWIKDSGGMYTVTPSRGARAGETVYKARIWIKSRQDFAHFDLGVTLKQAQKRMHKILGDPEAALRERDTRVVQVPTFEELAKSFAANRESNGGSGYYTNVSKHWIAHFGKVPADKVTRAMVEDYRDTMQRDGYASRSIRKYVGHLSSMCRWARGRGLLADVPGLAWSRMGEGVTRPKEPRTLVTVLSREDEVKVLEAADDEARLVIRLMVESGMRQGDTPDEPTEAFTLRWGQVVDDNILIHESKTGRPRSIPINARLRAALDNCLSNLRSDILRRDIKVGKAPEAYVLSDPDGKPLNADKVWRRIASAMGRAEVTKPKGSRYNLFRHTCGSRLAEKGNSMATIATILGNTEEVSSRYYVRFSPGHLKAAMATLDTVTAPPTAPGRENPAIPGAEGQPEVLSA